MPLLDNGVSSNQQSENVFYYELDYYWMPLLDGNIWVTGNPKMLDCSTPENPGVFSLLSLTLLLDILQ
ncbi:unnamed protein product [Caretta caretta]